MAAASACFRQIQTDSHNLQFTVSTLLHYYYTVVTAFVPIGNWSPKVIKLSPCSSFAIQSKNAVCANIKHRPRYFYYTANFWSIHFHTESLYVHMFYMEDTPFSYGRALIVH